MRRRLTWQDIQYIQQFANTLVPFWIEGYKPDYMAHVRSYHHIAEHMEQILSQPYHKKGSYHAKRDARLLAAHLCATKDKRKEVEAVGRDYGMTADTAYQTACRLVRRWKSGRLPDDVLAFLPPDFIPGGDKYMLLTKHPELPPPFERPSM